MASSTRTVTVNIVGDSTGLTRSLGTAGDTAQTSGSKIGNAFKGAFGAISTAAGSTFGPLQDLIGNLSPAIDTLSKKGISLGTAMVGVGTGMAGAGAALTAFGSKDQAAAQQLAQAITNTGGSMADYQSKIDGCVKSGEKFGFTSAQSQNALQTLVTATGDTTTATADFGAVADLAAAKHEGLTEAATQYAKVLAGSGTKTLVGFGITTADVNAKMAASNGTMDKGQASAALLAAAIKGQAVAASDTWSGKLTELKTKIEDNVAAIGTKYGPAITAMGAGIGVAGGAIDAGRAILDHFKTSTDLVAGSTKAAAVAQDVLKGSTGMTALANGAAAASAGVEDAALATEDAALGVTTGFEWAALAPIIAIIAAIAIIGFGIYELATHWKTVWNGIKAVVVDIWHGIDSGFVQPIEGFFKGIPAFIKSHWQLILAILTGPIGLAVLFIKDHFGQILDFFTSIPSKMAAIGKTMWNWITDGLRAVVNAVASIWNKSIGAISFTIPPWMPFIGGDKFSMPKIPTMDAGGIVSSPTLALLAANNRPEAVIPLGSGPGGGAGGAGGHGHDIYLDGHLVGAATAPHVRTSLLQSRQNRAMTGLA